MTGKVRIWAYNSAFWPDIVRWPAVISCPGRFKCALYENSRRPYRYTRHLKCAKNIPRENVCCCHWKLDKLELCNYPWHVDNSGVYLCSILCFRNLWLFDVWIGYMCNWIYMCELVIYVRIGYICVNWIYLYLSNNLNKTFLTKVFVSGSS